MPPPTTRRISTSNRITARIDNIDTARALPQVAVDFRWPFMRDSGSLGHPADRADRAAGRRAADAATARTTNIRTKTAWISNSPTPTCSASTGSPASTGWTAGCALNAALHGAWYLGGTTFDGLIGQSYRDSKDSCFRNIPACTTRYPTSLRALAFSPAPWLDLTYRTRLDHRNLVVADGRHHGFGRRAEVQAQPAAISTPPTTLTRCSTRPRRRPRRPTRASSSRATKRRWVPPPTGGHTGSAPLPAAT